MAADYSCETLFYSVQMPCIGRSFYILIFIALSEGGFWTGGEAGWDGIRNGSSKS